MPQSKSRPHHQNHPAPPHAKPKQKGRAALAVMALFALLGVGIGWVFSGATMQPLLIGAVAGAIAGYIVGHQIDKAITKKEGK